MTAENMISAFGVLATIIAPILTLLISNYFENKHFPPVRNRNRVVGQWKGETIQNTGERIEITANVNLKWRKIKGKATIRWEEELMTLNIKGRYLSENYIHIVYFSSDPNIKNFGSQLLRIDAKSKVLAGLTIGYGSEQESIISGSTKLEKQK